MKTDLLNLNKIFTDRIFRIPDYQRGYAWREKHLVDYWNDLIQLENGKNHYVGVITFEDVQEDKYKKWEEDLWIIESKCFTPLYIVDGQQRLTSSIILIESIIEYNNSNKKLNYNSNEEITKRYIFESKDNGISKSYIFGYEKDNPSYEYLKTKIFLEKTDNSIKAEDTIYTHNLENAKVFFRDKLKKLSFKEVEVIFRKITQNFLFNIYAVSDDIDVNVAFEGMNNRGKPLSILEILKNRLIYLSTKINDCEHEKKKLRHSINEAWKSIYHHLGRNKLKPLDDDIFLLNHFFFYFGDLIIKDEDVKYRFVHRRLASGYKDFLLENFFNIKYLDSGNIEKNSFLKDKIDTKLIYNYVTSLKSSVETWFNVLNPSRSDFSSKEKQLLNNIFRINQDSEAEMFMVLILVFYEKISAQESRIALLTLIENMLFFNTLTSYRYYTNYSDMNDDTLLELSIALAKGNKKAHGVLNILNDIWQIRVNKKELIGEIASHFNSRGFYHWSGLRYFLYEYEQYLQSQSKSKRNKLDWTKFSKEHEEDYTTVEHIYPQTARKKCWSSNFKKFTQVQRYSLKNSLGNLLPLSQPKNSSLGNRCFSDKKHNINNTIGYSFGCYSENKVALNDDWCALDILTRGIELTEFFQQRWNIVFTRKQILMFLGIEFLIKTEKIDFDALFKKRPNK